MSTPSLRARTQDGVLLTYARYSIDSYMNIQLSNTEEYIDEKLTGSLGQVLIRCNNVLYIRGADQGENGDVKMED